MAQTGSYGELEQDAQHETHPGSVMRYVTRTLFESICVDIITSMTTHPDEWEYKVLDTGHECKRGSLSVVVRKILRGNQVSVNVYPYPLDRAAETYYTDGNGPDDVVDAVDALRDRFNRRTSENFAVVVRGCLNQKV